MKPWSTDANSIKIEEINTENLSKNILINNRIKDYLKIGKEDSKFFIIGPKGDGKTLLLKTKSQLYRNNNKSYKFIPELDLCEKIEKLHLFLSAEEFRSYSDLEIWEQIWKICLTILILKNINAKLPDIIENLISDAKTVSSILPLLLKNRRLIYGIETLMHQKLSPMLNSLRKKFNVTQVAVFIDNIDEGFDRFIGENLKKESLNEKKSNLSEKVWINAQLGIIQAVKSLSNSNKHITFNVSIRSEAFSYYNNSDKLQIEGVSTVLTYTKEEVRDILIKNINLTSPEKLIAPKSKNPFERLLGFNEIPHRFALDDHRKLKIEQVFSYMYRHTFGRPREIVEMGKSLVDVDREYRTPLKIGDVVNEAGNRLLRQYKREIVPYFNAEGYSIFCQGVKSNIISKKNVSEVDNSVKEKTGFGDFCNYLYQLGMLGCLVPKKRIIKTGALTQRFRKVAQSGNQAKTPLPASDFYILHPSMDKDIVDTHGDVKYSKNNIVGYENDFYPPILDVTKLNMVHFGNSDLALSFFLEVIKREIGIAIIYNGNSKIFSGFESLKIINQEKNQAIKFHIVPHNTSPENLDSLVGDWIMGSNIIVNSSNVKAVKLILKNSKIISSNIVNSDFDDIIRLANPANKSTVILFEVTKFARRRVENLVKKIKYQSNRFSSFIPVIIDCFTYGKLIQGDVLGTEHNEVVYSVPNDSKSEYIFYDKKKILGLDGFRDVFASSHLTKVFKGKSEFDFHIKKKIKIIDGVYRLYRVYMFKKLKDNISIEFKDLLRFFLRIQTLSLVSDHSKNLLNELFPGKSRTEIVREIIQIGFDVYHRVLKLDPRALRIENIKSDISRYKNKGSFPRQSTFFKYFDGFKGGEKYYIAAELFNIMEYVQNSNYFSVFISYSSYDRDVAYRIYCMLVSHGVKVYFYDKTLGFGHNLKKELSDNIANYDKTLCLVSKNFLQSGGCRFEFENAASKAEKRHYPVLWFINIDNILYSAPETIKYRFPKIELKMLHRIIGFPVLDLERELIEGNYEAFDNKLISQFKIHLRKNEF